jgi:TfuA protein
VGEEKPSRIGYAFTGTTLPIEDARTILGSGWVVLPPIRRGDIPGILRDQRYGESVGVIIVIDGLFYTTESVSLLEIRDAIDSGWRVVGVSSMGALRAVEARPLGMEGVGSVFRWLSLYRVEDDDEIVQAVDTITCAPSSDAMIDIRAFLRLVVKRGIVEPQTAAAVAREMKLLFFPHRTIRLAASMLGRHATQSSRLFVTRMVNEFRGPKQRDAVRALVSLKSIIP